MNLMPTPATRSDVAYLDFVEGFREYLLGTGANFESRLDAALQAAGVRELDDICRFVHEQPLGQLRDRLARTQQEMKWHALQRSFDEQRTVLRAELEAWDMRGPGRLQLDPSFVYPPYVNVHFHLQPGGYFKDELSGFLYHYGTKVFFRGGNDRDELHGKLVSMVPRPADGEVARVLDMACSVGQSATAFKRRYPKAEVIGIDYSAPMLRVAHRRAAMLGEDVTFRQALIEQTGYPDAHFDVTFAFIVFHELPLRIIHETVREAARVTRPGGLFAVFDFTPTADKTPFQRYHRWFDARHNGEPYSQDFCDCRFEEILAANGFSVAATPLDQRSGGAGYMTHWFATRD
ncbi:MAG: class I SAM-dependent methyltransferase [Gammaproteobacteria bacterium]|nr:class I SAM-dependent methyltransferase [Gammaproteobacteria bacterium]